MSSLQRMILVTAAALAALLLVACEPGTLSDGSGEGEADLRVAGSIGDEEVSVAALDGFIRDQLWARATKGDNPSDVFELRKTEFERMASERALEADAEAQGLSAEELLTRESMRDVVVSEEQIRGFYETNKARLQGRSYEEAVPLLRSFLERQGRDANAQRYLASLRDRSMAEFSLSPERIEVAGTGPSAGKAEAPVTIIEFSDYECPYCKQAESVVDEVRQRYPDHVRVEYRHFPLEEIHPNARGAAEAASCADRQDRFWDFHQLIFEKAEDSLSGETLRDHAATAGLDLDAYDTCVADRAVTERVDQDLSAGRDAGVKGTPTFFVNGIMVRGGGSADDFAKIIDGELERIRAGG